MGALKLPLSCLAHHLIVLIQYAKILLTIADLSPPLPLSLSQHLTIIPLSLRSSPFLFLIVLVQVNSFGVDVCIYRKIFRYPAHCINHNVLLFSLRLLSHCFSASISALMFSMLLAISWVQKKWMNEPYEKNEKTAVTHTHNNITTILNDKRTRRTRARAQAAKKIVNREHRINMFTHWSLSQHPTHKMLHFQIPIICARVTIEFHFCRLRVRLV